tara:strand:- start:851 stop:2656 length:1806 start_codon:yes stop_codon:yes gene_type:complete
MAKPISKTAKIQNVVDSVDYQVRATPVDTFVKGAGNQKLSDASAISKAIDNTIGALNKVGDKATENAKIKALDLAYQQGASKDFYKDVAPELSAFANKLEVEREYNIALSTKANADYKKHMQSKISEGALDTMLDPQEYYAWETKTRTEWLDANGYTPIYNAIGFQSTFEKNLENYSLSLGEQVKQQGITHAENSFNIRASVEIMQAYESSINFNAFKNRYEILRKQFLAEGKSKKQINEAFARIVKESLIVDPVTMQHDTKLAEYAEQLVDGKLFKGEAFKGIQEQLIQAKIANYDADEKIALRENSIIKVAVDQGFKELGAGEEGIEKAIEIAEEQLDRELNPTEIDEIKVTFANKNDTLVKGLETSLEETNVIRNSLQGFRDRLASGQDNFNSESYRQAILTLKENYQSEEAKALIDTLQKKIEGDFYVNMTSDQLDNIQKGIVGRFKTHIANNEKADYKYGFGTELDSYIALIENRLDSYLLQNLPADADEEKVIETANKFFKEDFYAQATRSIMGNEQQVYQDTIHPDVEAKKLELEKQNRIAIENQKVLKEQQKKEAIQQELTNYYISMIDDANNTVTVGNEANTYIVTENVTTN